MKTRIIVVQLALLISCFASSQRIMENLTRGLVAVRVSSDKVFLSWRLLGSDPEQTAFHLYRDGVKITETALTGATNYTDQASSATEYTVKTLVNGTETGEAYSAAVLTSPYFDIPMNVPNTIQMPDGSSCYFSPNDCSTGDLDGDGNLDIVVKWDPSNAKDNAHSGHTGNVYIDGYKLDGTFLFRIDLGKNIRAGAHYTQFQVADYDGDGKAEIVCKTAPGTKDGTGAFISKGPAATASHSADYRNSGGYVLSGPEYLTVFSGLTGEELATANYNPARGNVSSWGDNYGNRVDRFLAGTAWLDGVLPSIIMARGYYTRAVIAAWNFRNGALTPVWTYDSGNNSGSGLYGQGNHNMSIGDVDDDGFDEIIWGAGAVDHDGKLMYRTGLGHGDAMHLSDLDPQRKGLELWTVHESKTAAYGEEMHDARTGEIIWGTYTGTDNGRGMAANLVAGNRSFEMWSGATGGIRNAAGMQVSATRPSINFRIYWDGDAEDELLDGTTITKYPNGVLLSANQCASNNGTKSTPGLVADLLGDWREEVVFRTADNKALRVYTTTIPTNVRQYTLMHDPVYRAAIAWQNTAYNQPPHLGFYMGSDMDTPPASPVYTGAKRWNKGGVWDVGTTAAWTDKTNQAGSFQQNDAVVFDFTVGENSELTLNGTLSPSDILVNSSYSVDWKGSGTITGPTALKKTGSGTLFIRQAHSFTGSSSVWNGLLVNNGELTNSKVYMYSFSTLAGNGTFGNTVQAGNLSVLEPGASIGETGSMRFNDQLVSTGKVRYVFDITVSEDKVLAGDTLLIGSDWTFSEATEFEIRATDEPLVPGNYALLVCNGTVNGELSKIAITGVPSYLSYSLVYENNSVWLKVSAPAILTWTGAVDNRWDNGSTSNWKFSDETRVFNGNDSVLFSDESSERSILVSDNVNPAHIFVDAENNFFFSGSGSIGGTGGITKKGNGRMTISTTNSFTGPLLVEGGSIDFNKFPNGGVSSPIGAASRTSSNIRLNGGKLHYTGATTTTDRAISLGEKGGSLSVGSSSTVLTTGQISGPGRLTKEGAGRIAFAGANSYSGGTTILGGTIGLTSDIANISGFGSGDTITLMGGTIAMYNSTASSNTSNWNLKIPAGASGTLIVDGRSMISGSITGEGTLSYFTPFTANILSANVSRFRGTINVTTDADGGYFVVYNANGYEGAKINLYNNVTMMYPVTSNVTIPIGELAGFTRSELGAGGTGICTITWEIGARNNNSTFFGLISDKQYSGSGAKAAIRKTGTGILTLTNANTYSGTTVVAEGKLMIMNNTGSGTGSGAVTVLTDASLGGTGRLDSEVTIEAGGELAPGGEIGKLTLNKRTQLMPGSFLVMDIATDTHDQLAMGDSLVMQGILQINTDETTALVAGSQFKLIDGPVKGIPSEIRPAVPGSGLEWDLSTFESEGILRVVPATGLPSISDLLQLYPNPVQDQFTLQLNQPTSSVQVSVYTVTGAQVITGDYRDVQTIVVQTGHLPAGSYLVKIQHKDYSFTRPIVKY